MSASSKKVITAYVPVIHRGYLHFLEANSDAAELYVFGPQLIKKVDYLRKDLRALTPAKAVKSLEAITRFSVVAELSPAGLKKLDQPNVEIIMPDEDISREIAKDIKKAKVTFYPIFLRWDRHNVDQPDESAEVSRRQADQKLMRQAAKAADSSSDIWRRVGAVLVSADGRELGAACNRGEPTEHSPWAEGDPRNVFNRGVGIEMSLFTHAEARLVAEAANAGHSTKGASMYVTAFPCPACAKLIAHSGIKNLYYKDGYAVLDGKRILDDYHVRVRKVEIADPPKSGHTADIPYVGSS